MLLHGDGFGRSTVVKLAAGGRTIEVTPSSVTSTAVTFVYPRSLPCGVVTAVVKNGERASKPFSLNQPEAWWIQGNLGREASCENGEVWVFGRNLGALCSEDGGDDSPNRMVAMTHLQTRRTHVLKARFRNSFCVKLKYDGLPQGEYSVALPGENGSDPCTLGTIEVVPAQDFWKPNRFNVVEFGATANDGVDDTCAILAALDKLRENNGGILYFPRGRFQMTAMIELPPHSAVIGAGQHLSEVYWPDTYEPVDALIKGTHSFGVKDIFLACGFHKDGIVSNPRRPKDDLSDEEATKFRTGNVWIHDVTLRMLYSEYVNSSRGERARRLGLLHHMRALRLAGENVQVRRCNVHCAAGGVFELGADWGIFDHNDFSRGNITGWNGFAGQHLIFEHNALRGANCTSFYGLPEGSENIFWGFNLHENTFDGNNRETITGDGRIHSYMDTIENITPQSFTLRPNEKGKVVWARGEHRWTDAAVQIAGGKGVGQLRRIKNIGGARVEIDRPWDVMPDESSVINIGSFRRRFIYLGNTAFDSSCALQFYGSMIEGIFSENTTRRTGGYNADAMTGESNWYNQFFHNTIETGNAYRGPRNEVPPIDAQLGLLAYGDGNGKQKYPLIRACVLRNNRLQCSAKINVMGSVHDSLIESNHIAEADRGIVVSESARNIVLRNNTFRHVACPYVTRTSSVVIAPSEEIQSGIQSAAYLLQDDGIGSEDVTPENAQQRLLETVQYLCDNHADKPLPPEVVENLLGVFVSPANWRPLAPLLREGRAGSAGLYTVVRDSCRVRAKLTMEVRPEDFPHEGWEFNFPEFAIEPGKVIAQNITLTKPEGEARFVSIPVTCTLIGDGWKLKFLKEFADPWETLTLTGWHVAPTPLDNPGGAAGSRIAYVAHKDLPKVSADSLVPCVLQHGRLALGSLYQEADDGKLAYAVSHIQARRRKNVRFAFGRNCLLYVNGGIVGTAQGRGQWGFVELQEGDNVVELLALPSRREEYRVSLPRITHIEDAMPGDVVVQK